MTTLAGAARISQSVLLAWYLRQRDSRRALSLVNEVDNLLRNSPLMPDQRRVVRARMAIIRAEVAALFREFEQAEELLHNARTVFFAMSDLVGEGDTALTESLLALEQGQMERASSAARHAVNRYQLTGDALRSSLAQAWEIYLNAYSDADNTNEQLQALIAISPEPRHPALAALISAAQGEILFSPELTRSAVMYAQASEFARQAGLVRLAIMAAANAGVCLQKLGDFNEAAASYDWAVSRARQTGWPALIGFSLMRLGELLRHLGQLDQSQIVLQEALESLDANKSGIHKAIAQAELANTLLLQGEAEQAARYFASAIGLYREAGSRNNLAEHLICYARALSASDKPEQALAAIAEARQLIIEPSINALGVDISMALAEIHAMHKLPYPSPMTAPNIVLHFLQEALSFGKSLQGWLAPSKLLLSLAEAWSEAGDGQRAFAYAKQAIAADRRERTKQASNWATLMQVRYETECARAEALHHQQLAATLIETTQTLDLLSKIGQEITADLNLDSVCRTLHRHLEALLDASDLSIWLLANDGIGLNLYHKVENGEIQAIQTLIPDRNTRHAARCVTEAQELLFETDGAAADDDASHASKIRTALFGPLVVGDRVLGVMSIQSLNQSAYAERQRLIFRSLCAYGAIALDNAHAHHDLQKTQLQLEQALKELEEASLTDPLTGLKNRRFLSQNIEADVALSVRSYQASSTPEEPTGPKDTDLLMFLVDLDHFKQVNDKYGHAAGDAILVQIRQRLQQVFRDSDYLIRWGGEEFLIVARGTSRDRAEELAERVRNIVAEIPFQLEGDVFIGQTCSIGFACFPFVKAYPRAIDWQDVIDIADIALYSAKHCGRNSWVGLHAEEHAWPELLLCTLKADAQTAILNKELRLSTNKEQETVLHALAKKPEN
ncbi:GGDEF domain-containing protein [Undibacterium sp. Jales W-56]|uniref:GGDEF domain-containing protein n=1 Tax=Undibacterium sp. Jales W-56 TaxID=2897325 RepID=UPI0021D23A01|nr:GGDEF domain-containing protein [Undibacterium sp. Jales W-56]MCU6433583.1 GGDEF domain-containing protein [Undibacterium sp. Jales W-56]